MNAITKNTVGDNNERNLLKKVLLDINELIDIKVFLYILWFIDQQEGNSKYIQLSDLVTDNIFIKGLNLEHTSDLNSIIMNSILSLEHSEFLLSFYPNDKNKNEGVYFLNSERNRAIINALESGDVSINDLAQIPAKLEVEKPSIYKLYEENMGPLTPMIAEALRDAEKSYPYDWIVSAFQIAVEKNVRHWRYISAILISWQEKGRDGSDRKDNKEDRKRYFKGKYADFIEH